MAFITRRRATYVLAVLTLSALSMYIFTTQFKTFRFNPQAIGSQVLQLVIPRGMNSTSNSNSTSSSTRTLTTDANDNIHKTPVISTNNSMTHIPTTSKDTAATTLTKSSTTTSSTPSSTPSSTSSSTTSLKTTTTTITPTTTTSLPTTDTTPDPKYTCSFPILDPFDPLIKQYVKNYSELTCDGKPSVAYLEEKTIKLDEKKIKDKLGSIDYCQYTPLKLSSENDLHLEDVKWSKRFTKSIDIPDDLEHFLVQCMKGDKVVAETYKSRVFEKSDVEKRSAERYKKHVAENHPSETMSVMFVGMDGMSKQNLIRTMPKTRNFLLQTMNARELNMFNKVGDNTFQNVIVLLSGRTHLDFGKIKGWNMKKNYFDSLDNMFVWNAYQQAGYRTASIFDIVKGTAFHYLKRGWKNPPFDYYHRPGPLMMDKRSKEDATFNCVGDQREAPLLLDYYLELTAKFNDTKTKPYFAYSFLTHLSHDDQNEASKGDDMYHEFFTKLHQSNVLNNTILVFFSDHGPRFGEMRRTFNGFVEGRTPYFFFIFPPWFENKYQKEMLNLQTNQNRLTTFFDIHATLYDILHFRGNPSKNSGDLRGTSLFKEIPSSRTCEEANIPTEYCLCKDLSKQKVSEKKKKDLAYTLLDMINDRTKDNRNICAKLDVKSIRSVLNFVSGKSQEYYQVTIQTTPGDGDFEALLSINEVRREAVLVGDIVRLNFYKGQDGCVNTLALKPFCYCLV